MTEHTPNHNTWPTSRTKRIADVCVSAGALVVTSPALVVAVAAKYLEDFKNPFFHQARLGRGGEMFYIHKIRTLEGTADHQTVGHGPHDKRATKVGRFLRKYAIDEIPQLWNILKGDMSLFGARPINEADQQHMRAALGDEAYQNWLETGYGPGRPGVVSSYVLETRLHPADVRTEKEYYQMRAGFDRADAEAAGPRHDVVLLLRAASLLGAVATGLAHGGESQQPPPEV